MLKKVGFLASSAIGLSLLAAPFASADTGATSDFPDQPSFGDAVDLFTDGGAALGYGATATVAGAYTGIALTPELILDSLDGDGDITIPGLGG
ncbi:hypothetical protein [Actinokineospora bangkokensis]|uniref:Uncharacterized protein n=1 Tax=Actinokineospora bangkokensis TaxID=1193682 RepID=A0A1Q9LDD0_9PSEU|nr:hypothetical protein [Actinokineospora bangkokensis]OLR90047.1 hypothetical protein BJP25_03455 [Actinokineospora bangkokensis]